MECGPLIRTIKRHSDSKMDTTPQSGRIRDGSDFQSSVITMAATCPDTFFVVLSTRRELKVPRLILAATALAQIKHNSSKARS
ncbi:hypothetical protein GWI33_011997 [Rhynchophorus ferrugineus]|uniref:Uncharacterized protein n=1 Tax=Rhynchophorus ferrugineus TaxID=354439 RepID=A0A834MJ05_RHYFE|nr:hypothetical protein GWI33_011997 [Rhynchophorus ferrugineus]